MPATAQNKGRKACMAHVAHGLGDIHILQDWEWDEVLRYQSKNGSLFNSPSATSPSTVIEHTNAFKYLDLLGNKFVGSGVLVVHGHIKNPARTTLFLT